ncbi:hypothetical protein VCHENC01_3698 [Vibrio harveyi]|nr:hypothetical protein VCHENC01_3698 [Vibrio harveyi]
MNKTPAQSAFMWAPKVGNTVGKNNGMPNAANAAIKWQSSTL